MRKFASFIERKREDGKNIMFMDLSYASKMNDTTIVAIGIKEKVGGWIGVCWNDHQLDVENDFSILEFQTTCEKYNIPCSVFSGDSETYGLK